MSKKKKKHRNHNTSVELQKKEAVNTAEEKEEKVQTPKEEEKKAEEQGKAPEAEERVSEQSKDAEVKKAEEDQSPEEAKSKSGTKKVWMWVGIAAAAVFAVALITVGVFYGKGVKKYKECFVRGVYINGVDCSDMEPAVLCNLLDSQINGYVLEIYGRNPQNPAENVVIGRITPEDVGLHRADTQKIVGDLFGAQNPYQWYKMYWEEQAPIEFTQDLAFDGEKLEKLVAGWEACSGKEIVAAQDAYISDFDSDLKGYQIIPETMGSQIEDYHIFLPEIEKALYAYEAKVDIESTDCYKKPEITADDEEMNQTVEEMNRYLKAQITYDWYGTELIVDGILLDSWVSLVDGEAVLDEDAVKEFVVQKAQELDPNGHVFTFTTALGSDLELKCKSGWKTDTLAEGEELLALIKEGAVTDRRPVSSTKNYVWFDGGVGNSYAEADLSNQHFYLYIDSELVLETDFVSGDMATGHRTPEGIYATTYKTTNRILRGPGYASFVNYWMPFYGNYGMHDATWRSVFGGQIYKTNGSHGCVNLPLAKAKTIYSYVEVGFPVICYYYPDGENPALKPAPEVPEDGEQMEGSQETEEPIEENEIHGQW